MNRNFIQEIIEQMQQPTGCGGCFDCSLKELYLKKQEGLSDDDARTLRTDMVKASKAAECIQFPPEGMTEEQIEAGRIEVMRGFDNAAKYAEEMGMPKHAELYRTYKRFFIEMNPVVRAAEMERNARSAAIESAAMKPGNN